MREYCAMQSFLILPTSPPNYSPSRFCLIYLGPVASYSRLRSFRKPQTRPRDRLRVASIDRGIRATFSLENSSRSHRHNLDICSRKDSPNSIEMFALPFANLNMNIKSDQADQRKADQRKANQRKANQSKELRTRNHKPST